MCGHHVAADFFAAGQKAICTTMLAQLLCQSNTFSHTDISRALDLCDGELDYHRTEVSSLFTALIAHLTDIDLLLEQKRQLEAQIPLEVGL